MAKRSLFRGVWHQTWFAIVTAILAASATVFLNWSMPEHPVSVNEFIALWLLILVPTALIIWLWRWSKSSKAKESET